MIKKKDKSKVNAVNAEQETPSPQPTQEGDLGTLTGSWMLIRGKEASQFSSLSVLKSKADNRKIRRHIYDNFGRWKPSNVEPHGILQLTMEACHTATSQQRLPKLKNTKPIKISALVDTGAQMCVCDYSLAKQMGLTKHNMLTPALTISVADNADLELIGAAFMLIKSDKGPTTRQLVYFATGVGQFYLSKQACFDLGIIGKNFPQVGSCNAQTSTVQPSIDAVTADAKICDEVFTHKETSRQVRRRGQHDAGQRLQHLTPPRSWSSGFGSRCARSLQPPCLLRPQHPTGYDLTGVEDTGHGGMCTGRGWG